MRLIILGLGPAASAAAIAACSLGAEVIVVGREAISNHRPGETLAPTVTDLLNQLGVYELIQQTHLPSPGIVSSWEVERPYENDFLFNPYGDGWHLDRALFDEQLLDVAAQRGAKVMKSVRLGNVVTEGKGNDFHVVANVDGKSVELSADCVIDATGRSSWYARRVGVPRRCMDRLIGIVGFLNTRNVGDDARTYIEAYENGWWYFANVPGNRSVAAFMTDSDIAVAHPGGPKGLWQSQLPQSQRGQMMAGVRVQEIKVVAASSSRLSKFRGDRWIAAGDAAISWDPLSSQGISSALESGIRAADSLIDSQRHHQDYSDWMESRWDEYVQSYKHFYGSVTRFGAAEFWRRRGVSNLSVSVSSRHFLEGR